MQLSQGAIWFRERAGLAPTVRGPLPAAAPDLNAVHAALALPPPRPWPALLLPDQGAPPPDRGGTTIWPFGLAGEAPP